nr:hypothetical protein [Mucilaginibacter sp. SP1R1]
MDSVKNTSVGKNYSLIGAKGRRLVVIDGIIYKKAYKQFDINDILDFALINPPGSVNIYRPQAADGAILITSKVRKEPDATSIKSDSVIYILNGDLSNKREISALDVNDVLSINILKYDEKSVSEESRDKHILIATSKSFAIKSYQKKISSFLKEYKAYLKVHDDNDNKLLFVINGNKYPTSTDDRIKKLYEIFADDIAFSSFYLYYVTGSGPIPSSVEIKTK